MNRPLSWFGRLVLMGVGVLGFVTSGAAVEPYPLELAFTRRTIERTERAAVRPDGRHVVYGVVTPTKHHENWFTTPSGAPAYLVGSRLRVVDVATGAETVLGSAGTISFAPAWSPDGGTLAYYADEGGELGAWLFDPATGRSRRAAPIALKVHRYSTVPMPPTWSPDGANLLIPALPSDERGADPILVAGATERTPPASGPRVVVLTTGNEPPSPQRPAAVPTPAAQTAADIVAIDVATGQSRLLLPAHPIGRLGPAAAGYSPSGRFLVVSSVFRKTATDTEPKDSLTVAIVPVGATEPTFREVIPVAYDGEEAGRGDNIGRTGVLMGWHPTRDVLLFCNEYRLRRVDCTGPGAPEVATLAQELGRLNGDYLALDASGENALIGLFPDDANNHDDHRATGLALVPLGSGPARRFELPGSANRGQVVRRAGLSLWEPVPNTVTLVGTNVGGTGTLFRRLDLATGRWTDSRADSAIITVHGMPRDASFLVGEVESYAHAPNFYRITPEGAAGQRLGVVDARLDGFDLGTAALFDTVVPLHDGKLRSVRSAVLLPPGSKVGGRLPTLMTCYGGSGTSGQARRYGGDHVATIAAPVFTTRGYAVLLVDATLGPEGEPGNPIEQLRDVILPQVYHAAELGYVDINRVAVSGQSYGGYCTAALVSSTHLFRAAIAVSGIYNLADNYAEMGSVDNSFFGVWWSEQGQGRMGQPPWFDFRRYFDNSPFYRADRIRTPLLLIHGQDDRTCDVHDAERMFSALRRLGQTAQLAVYQGEGHVVWEWELANATDAAQRILDFLDRHLKPH